MSPTELESPEDRGFPGVRKKTVSFRTKLIYLTAALVGCVGIIFISAQFYRPIEKLYERIHTTKLLLEKEVGATIDPVDLDRMNRFALDTIRGIGDVLPAYDKNRDYFFLSFNMLLSEGKILPKQKLVQMAKQGEIGGFENHFDYESLDETQYYWRMRFAEDPGIFRIFQKYKSILIKAKEEAGNSLDFSIADVYIMIDSGTQNGFFQDNIAFVLDGYRWSESPSYCGEPYEAGTGNLRNLALAGLEGSDHSLIADPDHWYLPNFVKNEWGSWFGVWQTRRTQDVYNTFTVYFDASYVKKQMQSLVITVVCGIAFLLIILGVLYRRTARRAASENY